MQTVESGMAEQAEKTGARAADNDGRAGAALPKAPVADSESRAKFRGLTAQHMPRDFSVSLDAYRRGGTDAFLGAAPAHAARQDMTGFESRFSNVVDYIVRITHQIWEEKDIGYIYDTYSHDCSVWDDAGLSYGRDKVVADTISSQNAFPDLRVVADEVIWAGDAAVAFHTSHRTQIFGTNTGWSRWGAPTGRRVQFWCMANCVARDNEIFYEHVVYDTAGILTQLGFDAAETARRAAHAGAGSLPSDFLGGEPARSVGQGKPERVAIPASIGDSPEEFVRASLHTLWNRRNLAAVERVYRPSVVAQMTGGRVFRGAGQIRSFMLSLLAQFPDLFFSVDDLYWMGNRAEGFLVAIRWSMSGHHRGLGRWGEPTGREVNLWGITHWVIEDGAVAQEWTTFNEFGLLMQIKR
jgi:predicted ester cyclase